MLVVFSPIFAAGTKIIFRYDFVAPLKAETWSLTSKSLSGDSQSKKVNCSVDLIRVRLRKLPYIFLISRWIKTF